MNKKQIAITLGFVCLVLTMLIFIQIKTINNTNQIVSQTFTNNNLRDQVLRWKERYDTAYSNLQEAETMLEKVRIVATENTEGSAEKEQDLKRNNMLLGLTDVQGQGIVVSLKDNASVTAESISVTDNISYYLVHDLDIRSIVNELQNAGAEAISINDQRVVTTTSITCEGNVISVNGQKISSPFIIKSIGNSLRIIFSLN